MDRVGCARSIIARPGLLAEPQKIIFDLQLADLAVEFADLDFVGLVVPVAAVLEHAPSSSAFFQAWIWLGWTLYSPAISLTVRSPLSAAKATFALNVALCFCRDCFMTAPVSGPFIGAGLSHSHLSHSRGPSHPNSGPSPWHTARSSSCRCRRTPRGCPSGA